jgi:hypothetical protein
MTKIWQDLKGVRGWINELRGKGLTLASGGVLVNGPGPTSAMAYRWLMKQVTSRFDMEFDRSLARRG